MEAIQHCSKPLLVDDRGFTWVLLHPLPESLLINPPVYWNLRQLGVGTHFQYTIPVPQNSSPVLFQIANPASSPTEEAEHEDEEDEDVMALKPFEDESSKPRGSRGAKKTAKSKLAESEESEPDLEPLSSWAAIKQNPC